MTSGIKKIHSLQKTLIIKYSEWTIASQ